VHGVELETVIVYLTKCTKYAIVFEAGRVGKYGNLSRRIQLVAQGYGIVNNTLKLGVQRGLAIAGKGNYIEGAIFVTHLCELTAQGSAHLLAVIYLAVVTIIGIVATLAIDTIV
jgi:hypothetical protein